ncbi:hypothetical protein M426DRAFT_325195 [Hypoxylon sp. CI-4A]|nr:hypothetical protein M426DRAFT_325195 [Hypoxylon sp. CI-4A]
MKFAIIFALAFPAIALAQEADSTTSTPPAASGPPDLSVCEKQAGPYADACPRCNSRCVDSSAYEQCLTSVFTMVNSYQAQCEQQGGNNCKGQALDQVCGQ